MEEQKVLQEGAEGEVSQEEGGQNVQGLVWHLCKRLSCAACYSIRRYFRVPWRMTMRSWCTVRGIPLSRTSHAVLQARRNVGLWASSPSVVLWEREVWVVLGSVWG